jgi:PAS domain S-box-containing protein
MSSTSPLQVSNKTPVRFDGRLAWLPILLLLAAIIVARMSGLNDIYEARTPLLILSFTFYTLVSLGTLYLIGRSFLGLGMPGLLMLECGVVLWSLSGTVADLVFHGDENIDVTIFNTGIWLAGLFHLAGAIFTMRPQRVLRARFLWLGSGCAFTLAALWLITWAALSGRLPVFFIPGHGGTPLRYIMLSSAIGMFVLSSALLRANQRVSRLPFTYWYSLALLLLAVGLFGIMIQLSMGSAVNWLSRSAQWLGGLYLLFAALASLRESQLPLLPPGKKTQPAYYRDAIAVAFVLSAAAIRLTFLSAMGSHSPYLIFFPAVMLAAIYGGLRAGLLATMLSAIFANYFLIKHAGLTSLEQPDVLALLVFILSGAMTAWVSDAVRLARTRVSEAETQALLAAEREAASENLYAGRAKLEAALASMTDAVFISDTQGRFIDFNDAFATFHKFRNKDECAKTLAEYPDILDVFMSDGTLAPLDMWAVPRALRGETVTNAEYILRRKDTSETWVGSYSFSPIRDKNGTIIGSVVVGRDITESKRVEEALRQSEARYRELFNTLMEGFCIIEVIFDNDNRPVDYRFLECNPAFEAQTGLKNTQGRHMRELAPENEEHWFEIYGKIALTGEPARFINEAKALNRWYEVYAYRVGNPEDRQVAIVFNDISVRKRAENVLRNAHDKLEELVHERTQKLDKMEAAMRLANAYNRSLIEVSLDPLVTISSEGKITDVNAATEAATDRDRAELIGTDFSDYFTDPEKARSGYEQAFREGSVRDYALELRHRDGRTIPVLYNASVYHDEEGKVIGVFAAARDITEQKRAQKALGELNETLELHITERTAELQAANEDLRDSRVAALNLMEDAIIARREAEKANAELQYSEARFRLLSETAEKLIMWKDVHIAIDDLCKKAMNFLSCQVFFNYLVDEKIGRLRLNTFAGIPDEAAKKLEWLNYGEAVSGWSALKKKPVIIDNVLAASDPRAELIKSFGIQAYACYPLMIQNEVIGTLAFGTMTRTFFSQRELILIKRIADQMAAAFERKNLLDKLQESRDELELKVHERTADLEKTNEALRQSNIALEDFAHVASHDLQEPLRKIMTFSDRLVTERQKGLTDQMRDYLVRVQQSAERMQSLVRDLAKYSHVTSGKQHFKIVNLKKPVEDAVMDLKVLLEENQGSVEIGALPDVEANEIQIHQLFMNLIGNALKYRGSQKPVIKVFSDTSSGDGFHEIHVQDNGIGFDEMYLDKIFKPFQRLHGRTSPYQGTGMGLAICRRIVEYHGGSITAKSEPGKGSTFIIRLPKKHAVVSDKI